MFHDLNTFCEKSWQEREKIRHINVNIFRVADFYYQVSFRASIYLKPGVIFSPSLYGVDYNVHESFATFGEIRDSEGGR